MMFSRLSSRWSGPDATLDARLQRLDPPRTDSVEQRLHLIWIAASFQNLTARAVDAYYNRDKCFSTKKSLRLATRIKALKDSFSSLLRKHGATRESGPESAARRPSVAEIISDSESDRKPKKEADLPDTMVLLELSSVLPQVSPNVQNTQQNILVRIRSEFERSRGFELGAFHPSLLPALYHEQMKHWRYFTLEHIGQVVRAFMCSFWTCCNMSVRTILFENSFGLLFAGPFSKPMKDPSSTQSCCFRSRSVVILELWITILPLLWRKGGWNEFKRGWRLQAHTRDPASTRSHWSVLRM